jgi:hypothetical protein
MAEISDYLLISTALILIVSFAFLSVMVTIPEAYIERASLEVSPENAAVIVFVPLSISGKRENVKNWIWALIRDGRKIAWREENTLLTENIPVRIMCGTKVENSDILKIWYGGLPIFENRIGG